VVLTRTTIPQATGCVVCPMLRVTWIDHSKMVAMANPLQVRNVRPIVPSPPPGCCKAGGGQSRPSKWARQWRQRLRTRRSGARNQVADSPSAVAAPNTRAITPRSILHCARVIIPGCAASARWPSPMGLPLVWVPVLWSTSHLLPTAGPKPGHDGSRGGIKMKGGAETGQGRLRTSKGITRRVGPFARLFRLKVVEVL
jgi:hypothetical protein